MRVACIYRPYLQKKTVSWGEEEERKKREIDSEREINKNKKKKQPLIAETSPFIGAEI